MKDLYRSLGEYPEALIQAIAASWDVELARGEPLDQIRALGDAMLAPGSIDRVVAGLSPDATRALSMIAAHDGVLATHRLLGFGTVRRFGPARLARERPWQSPQNPLEELLFQGLIYRSYGTAGDQIGQVLVIPHQLLDLLRPLLNSTAGQTLSVGSATEIARIQASGDSLCEDMLAFLVHVRQGHVRAKCQLTESQSPSCDLRDLDLGSRLVGERCLDRLAFMRRLFCGLELIESDGDFLQPTMRARAWLRLPDRERKSSLVAYWRDDPSESELDQLLHVQIDQSLPDALMVRARRVLLSLLAACEADSWLSLDSFVATLKQERPDYLRPGGDYDSWPIRHSESGEYLAGFEYWDDIEGALARLLIDRPLFWLGLVDLGRDVDGALVAFRVSPLLSSLMATEDSGDDIAPRAEGAASARVDEDMTVHMALSETMYDRYQLERFADWVGQSDEAIYRMTPASLWRAARTDVRVEQILKFLRRVTVDSVPTTVEESLRVWEQRGRAALEAVIILESLDAEGMDEILADDEARRSIRTRLSAKISIVEQDRVEALVERLQAMNIWANVLLRGTGL